MQFIQTNDNLIVTGTTDTAPAPNESNVFVTAEKFEIGRLIHMDAIEVATGRTAGAILPALYDETNPRI
jgi:hypothetical protein